MDTRKTEDKIYLHYRYNLIINYMTRTMLYLINPLNFPPGHAD